MTLRSVRRLTVAAMAAAMLLPGSASAEVIVGHSGWFWGDPLPQGEQLNALDFTGGRGYAVGNFGVALRTDDGGATWGGLRTGTTSALDQVQAVEANTVLIGGNCSVRRSTDGGVTFTRLPFTSSEASCPSSLAAFDFPSPTIGYIVLEDGTVIRTADGGGSFSQRTPLPQTRAGGGVLAVQDVAFAGLDTGVAVLSGGRVYRTTDGGSTWTLSTGTTGNLRAVDFVDATTGFAVGEGGVFLHTEDGGATFDTRPFTGGGAGQSLVSVDCVSTTTCLMAISGADRLARTTDAGSTSTAVSPSANNLNDAAFASATRAVAVGLAGSTVISNDAGVNFTSIGGKIPGQYYRLRSEAGLRAYATGRNGRVARTIDGGRSWSVVGVSTAAEIRDVSFPVPATGFALDEGGTLLRTGNAGESWQILNTGSSQNAAAVLALDAQRVILVAARSVRRSTDGGQSFRASKSRALRKAGLNDIDRAGRAVFASGPAALAVSTNGGRTWSKVRRPRGTLSEVDFVSSRVGYLLTTSGRLYFTSNRGRRWREVLGVGTKGIFSIAFADARSGWLNTSFSDGPDVLRTTDGGMSWQPQIVTDTTLGDIAALSGTAAVSLDRAPPGRFYATAAGGGVGTTSRLSIKTSKRRLRKAATVRFSGRLIPARGGELVSVAMRNGTRWSRKPATVASNGTFTVSFRVKRTAVFVAQWAGDDRSAGDGTATVKVTVKKRKRGRR